MNKATSYRLTEAQQNAISGEIEKLLAISAMLKAALKSGDCLTLENGEAYGLLHMLYGIAESVGYQIADAEPLL